MNFTEICYWNKLSYGSSFTISKTQITSINLLLAVVIPIVYPVPVALFINKFIKNITIRYEVQNGRL